MTDRPIIFGAPMVRAILDGRKTVTRRLVKDAGGAFVPGDRLWVRETFAERVDIDGKDPAQRARAKHYLMFKANGDDPRDPDNFHAWGRWRSPRFMPRWASRITLDVVSVMVERLQAITEEDANREGVEYMDGLLDESDLCRVAKEMGAMATDSRVWFACLWDSLNASRAPWDSDPWVWRVEFRRVVTP